MEWKYIYKGFWIAKKDGKHYMKEYIHAPFSKQKRIREISEEEYEKYAKHIID